MKHIGASLPRGRRKTDGVLRPSISKFAAENEAAKVVAATYKDDTDPFVHFDAVFPTIEGEPDRTATLVAFLFDIDYGGESENASDIAAFGKGLAEP